MPTLGPKQLLAVTKSDTVDLPFQTLWLYVGSTGNVTVNDTYGNPTLLTNVAVGWMRIQITKIWSTGTAASGFVIGR